MLPDCGKTRSFSTFGIASSSPSSRFACRCQFSMLGFRSSTISKFGHRSRNHCWVRGGLADCGNAWSFSAFMACNHLPSGWFARRGRLTMPILWCLMCPRSAKVALLDCWKAFGVFFLHSNRWCRSLPSGFVYRRDSSRKQQGVLVRAVVLVMVGAPAHIPPSDRPSQRYLESSLW